jgi:hypothetical protein
MAENDALSDASPPAVLKCWLASRHDGLAGVSCEYPIFSDASIDGVWVHPGCPFSFIGTRREIPTIRRTPAAVVRMTHYFAHGNDDLTPPPYHAGAIQDELAALMSLCLGVRAKTTHTYTRTFHEGDPYGQPICTEEPLRVPEPPLWGREVAPRLLGSRNLATMPLFDTLPTMRPRDAGILVAAARLYQEGVWGSNLDPARTWLLLVSAVETAAGHTASVAASPIERMQAARPDLAQILVKAGGVALAEKVADQIADYMGSTAKFVNFLLKYIPEPPSPRVIDSNLQVSWTHKDLKRAFSQIYGYRSKTLHGGVAFPAPLCASPIDIEELPFNIAASVRKHVPMLLHVFEHIVRGALLNWWRTMIEAPTA